jgi:hypothetical protein
MTVRCSDRDVISMQESLILLDDVLNGVIGTTSLLPAPSRQHDQRDEASDYYPNTET